MSCIVYETKTAGQHTYLMERKINFYIAYMYTLQTILQKLKAHKPELQRKYPVSQLGVFGSYARGEATADSDIDIAVDITGPMGLNFVAMADE